MQNINRSRYGITDLLRGHWALFHRLWKALIPLAKAVHAAGGLVAIEWPLRCTYWRDAKVQKLMREVGLLHKAMIAACMYGLRTQRKDAAPDEFIGKHWRLQSTSSGFAAALNRRCDGAHRHVVTVGGETAASAYYPKPMAQAIHAALLNWSRGLGPRAAVP